MKEYNGFTAAERNKSWDIQKLLRDNKVMNWDNDNCEMCKQSGMFIMPHMENYFTVEEYHPLCVECHMNLHARMGRPIGWGEYLQKLRDGYQPKKWLSVSQFFGSKESKEIFKKSSNFSIFDASNHTDLQWFEKLFIEPIDLRTDLIKQGYSETHLVDLHIALKSKYHKRNKVVTDE